MHQKQNESTINQVLLKENSPWGIGDQVTQFKILFVSKMWIKFLNYLPGVIRNRGNKYVRSQILLEFEKYR